jgi:type I restriction enzyme S subunit
MTWPKIKLGDVCEIVSGSTPKTGVAEYWNGDVWWATPKDLSQLDSMYLESTEKRITEAGKKSCSTRLLPAGSVLFSSRAPIGHVAINSVPTCTNQGFKSFIPNEGRAHNKYLYFWLRANRKYLDSLGNGATFREVSKTTVERVEIPLPPLPEQKRLAAILDRADELRHVRRQVLARLDELAQSLFLELFGDPATNPKGWDVVPVSHCVQRFEGGKSIGEVDNGTGKVRVLKVSAVTSLEFRPQESKPLEDDYKAPAEHLVRVGDLLISRANTIELVAATAYVWATPDGLLLSDKIWRFIWREPLKVEPLFVWFLFRNRAFRDELVKGATGTSGSMKNISKEKMLSMPIVLPPLELQQGFALQIEELEAVKARARASLLELDALFASLQSRAFAGELSG